MKNPEQFAREEDAIETESNPEDVEQQRAIRQAFLDAVEETLIAKIDERAKPIPEGRRKLDTVTTADGKVTGKIEKIRKPEERDTGGQDLWLVVDFDDVLNHTTEFNRDLHKKLANATGMPIEEVERIYDESKTVNEDGKKVFRFTKFVEQVKSASKKPKMVDGIISGIEYGKFIDKAVKRALIASRFQFGKAVRISILTFGDPKYQKLRIDKTDVADFADDIIYTEGSKRETLQALLEEYRSNDYPYDGEIDAPFIITIDDNPEQVDDYDKLPMERRFVNMRFSHPQAKRYGKPHTSEQAVVSDETSPNQAAVNIYKATRIATNQHAQQDRDRLYRILHTSEVYDGVLSSWGGYQRDENIRYEIKRGNVIRTCQRYNYKEDWDKGNPVTCNYGPILPSGLFKKRVTGDEDVYWEEFIRE